MADNDLLRVVSVLAVVTGDQVHVCAVIVLLTRQSLAHLINVILVIPEVSKAGGAGSVEQGAFLSVIAEIMRAFQLLANLPSGELTL